MICLVLVIACNHDCSIVIFQLLINIIYAYAHIYTVLTDITNKKDFRPRMSQSIKQEPRHQKEGLHYVQIDVHVIVVVHITR